MKRRLILAGLLLVGITSVAMAVTPQVSTLRSQAFTGPFAGTPFGKTVSGCLGRFLVMRSELGVTDEQRTQIRNVLMSHRSEIAETIKSVRDKRIVLREAIRMDEPQEATIRAAADEFGNELADAAVKAAKLRGQIAPLLTTNQHQLIDKLLSENNKAIDAFLTNAAQGR